MKIEAVARPTTWKIAIFNPRRVRPRRPLAYSVIKLLSAKATIDLAMAHRRNDRANV
jgi:hypothetical protein